MSKRKAYSKAFHAALNYLHDNMGYKSRHIANVLTQIGLPVRHTTVHYWYEEKRLPQSQAMIDIVIVWAEYSRRWDCLFKELHATIDEIDEAFGGHTLESALAYLRDHGYSYNKIANLGSSLDTRTPRNWDKGKNKPRQQKGVDYLKGLEIAGKAPDWPDEFLRRITVKVPNELERAIGARVAGETGLGRKLDYALVPIVERYFDLFEPFLNADDKRVWAECFADYEKRKAQGIVEG